MNEAIRAPGRNISIGDACRKRNPHLFKPEVASNDLNREAILDAVFTPLTPKPQKRLRQSSKPLMNRLESEFYETIRHLYPNYPPVWIQAITFKIANGLRYCPDFVAASWPDKGPARMTAWEVKGTWVDGDSFPKLKMFASQFPDIRVLLVWKDSEGQWQTQQVLS